MPNTDGFLKGETCFIGTHTKKEEVKMSKRKKKPLAIADSVV